MTAEKQTLSRKWEEGFSDTAFDTRSHHLTASAEQLWFDTRPSRTASFTPVGPEELPAPGFSLAGCTLCSWQRGRRVRVRAHPRTPAHTARAQGWSRRENDAAAHTGQAGTPRAVTQSAPGAPCPHASPFRWRVMAQKDRKRPTAKVTVSTAVAEQTSVRTRGREASRGGAVHPGAPRCVPDPRARLARNLRPRASPAPRVGARRANHASAIKAELRAALAPSAKRIAMPQPL
ncbi:PREDICTED: uncharacterized protein LOC106148910 isoform X2 [Chinchilla lanigera]|uniref:uncharacterized protein LOC106148910 isoform X2 n=1 Tax=Chinchilla lanigera TaxID=34839 RepID=UPI0006989639|nr:PREDICTED: uncharacterized protein LOC106148910 isoform X2 [Chinchilla lanigera]